MQAPAVSRGYQRLAWATLAIVFVLVLIGGVVRVSESGLGCGPAGSGLEGWPLCHGKLVPGFDIHHIIEYTHRVVAAAVGLLILVLTVLAFRRFGERRDLKRLSATALVLVLFEGGLGGATVENDLHELLVAVHLGTAMLILATLLSLARRATGGPFVAGWPASVRRLSIGCAAGVWATIVAGGYMAGTQNYGRETYEAGDGAHMACGKEFPTCNGSLLPFGDARLTDIHLVHRAFMYVTVIALVVLAVITLREAARRDDAGVGEGRRWSKVVLVVMAAQVLLGALNVWLGEHPELIAAHLGVGTLLWLAIVWLTLSVTGGAPVPAGADADGALPNVTPAAT